MDTSDPASITCGEVKSELPHHPSEKPLKNHSNSSSNKQTSIFSLTIDEFQYKSGRSFGSMNIDEFLNSVWGVDGNPVYSNSNQNEVTDDENAATPINLPRQGSFSIPTPLCNKTVEEVWAEINRSQSPQHNLNGISDDFFERQQTFGEMTLEDFLVKVGVIQETTDISQQKVADDFQNHSGNFPCNEMCLDPSIGSRPMMGLEFSHPSSENNFLGNGSPMYQVFTPNAGFVGEPSNNIGNEKCNGVREVGEPHTKKRMTSGIMELAVERRHRRMIKNRESAARSRARKQAYTAELEIELNQLREENSRLKLIVEESRNKQKQEELKEKPSTKAHWTAEKFKKMRRTSSLDW
ncbi:ABSCISIC ACID-INSENSITIVE 5-like protein 1 [Camellia lanceoleosa]|uniref:ABSCISIC ACID-INSENSITIVE 5-like protein 1 n=1 Tax=Camellia lanceoleosa TaxID=1840588 RepID=A0ACC0F8M1_9ERIC|nr:ABSCISIC ACID-INSENSITIVE 5-like protein 1 [Camellia lanceoleosa]